MVLKAYPPVRPFVFLLATEQDMELGWLEEAIFGQQAEGRHHEITQRERESNAQDPCGPGHNTCSLYCGLSGICHSWLQGLRVSECVRHSVVYRELSWASCMDFLIAFSQPPHKAGVAIPFLWVKTRAVILKSGRQRFPC